MIIKMEYEIVEASQVSLTDEWLSKEGGKNGKLLMNGYRVSVLQDEKSYGEGGGDGSAQYESTSCLWTVHLNTVNVVHFMLSVFYHNKKKLKKIRWISVPVPKCLLPPWEPKQEGRNSVMGMQTKERLIWGDPGPFYEETTQEAGHYVIPSNA